MRALRFHGAGDLRLDEVAPPRPARGEVIVAVDACGVCGSDLHFLDGSAHTGFVPITLGHEIAGTITDPGTSDLAQGNRVVVAVGHPCGACDRCSTGRSNLCTSIEVVGIHRDGGLADLVAVPAASAIALPPGIAPEIGATAVDAGATAFHAITRRARVSRGDSVLIIGAGGLGGYGLQFARNAGATPVIVADSDPAALTRAARFGVDETLLVEEGMSLGRAVKLLTHGGVDAAIEFVGRASTVEAAVKSLRPGGRAVVVGVGIEPVATLPPVLWSNNEYTLTGSYGSLAGDVETVLSALGTGDITPPQIETVPLEVARSEILAATSGARRTSGRMVVVP